MLKGFQNLETIKDQAKLTNVKSKRRRNLVKKAIELSSLCDMETILLVRDKKNRRLTLYESHPDSFNIGQAQELLEEIKMKASKDAFKWTVIQYTNENYLNIKDESVSSLKYETPTMDNLSEGPMSSKTSENSLKLKRPRYDPLIGSAKNLNKINAKSQFSRMKIDDQ